MTTPPRSAPSSHLDPTTLADLDENLLDPEGTARAREHLAGCPACQARRHALTDVRGMLRRAGEVTPVPDDVVRRLDDALFAAAGGPATATAAATVTPITRRPPRNTRIVQVAAGVVLLLALGAVGFSVVQGSGSGSADSATSAAGGAAEKGADNGAPERAAASGGYPVTESGRDYTRESLRAAVPDLVRGLVAASAPAQADAESRQGAGRLLSGPPLAACVANLAQGRVTPLAVDAASFDGKPATIIVLPTAGDASTVDVYVVAPDCPEGTFVAWQRVPRP
jgi:hypothetical protein